MPVLLAWLRRRGRPLLAGRFGIEGLLAHANLSAAVSRLAVSVAALVVSLAMLAAIAVMVGSFRGTVAYWVGQTLQADLFVAVADGGRVGAFGGHLGRRRSGASRRTPRWSRWTGSAASICPMGPTAI